jgi:hypothetical protein
MNRDKTLMLKFATARATLARDGLLMRTSRLTAEALRSKLDDSHITWIILLRRVVVFDGF